MDSQRPRGRVPDRSRSPLGRKNQGGSAGAYKHGNQSYSGAGGGGGAGRGGGGGGSSKGGGSGGGGGGNNVKPKSKAYQIVLVFSYNAINL